MTLKTEIAHFLPCLPMFPKDIKKILLRTYLDLKIDGIFLSNWDKWKYLNSDLDWVVISAIKIENSKQYFMACNVE